MSVKVSEDVARCAERAGSANGSAGRAALAKEGKWKLRCS